MNIKRIIPILTVLNGDLVKTQLFDQSNYTYVGDVLNAVRIFNDMKAEEIIVIDIGATINNKEPNFEMIKKISSIARMPITYGGGINNINQAKTIFSYGVEKISISSSLFKNINFLRDLKHEFGSQSISVTFDIKKNNNDYYIFTNNGKFNTNLKPINFLEKIKDYAGELIINYIDRDGLMNGVDTMFIETIYDKVQIPLVITGGFGNTLEISKIFDKYEIIGVACGSLFIFKGRNKAVLINYPKDEILSNMKKINNQ